MRPTVSLQRLKINNVTMYDETREDLRQIPAVAFDKPIDPNTEDFCKFCYNSSSTKENPLITPCRCKDTVGLIHFECLKRWLSSKRMAKDNGHNSASYYYKTFECEICKFAYPYIFRVPSGDKYNLIDDIPIPEVDNLLVLESLHLDKNSSRAIHVILPDESMHNFKLGRGHEADIRINDISVSRVHATIDFDFEQGRYLVTDNKSKFGTLVIQKKQSLEIGDTKAFQIGRSFISFHFRDKNKPQPQPHP